ncbi:unnamed protein product [Closterium sp. Yama58-4]|nr:unnamed protein product [Closterium sp. Yama58-4]
MHTPVPSRTGLFFTLLSAVLPAADAASAAVLGVLSLPGVKHIVAVASAKGGVGKSTTAVNLAVALSRHMRLQVGLLDADVFGPSLPKLLGLATAGRPQLASPSPNARMLPLQAHGVLCMSMGFLMPADVAAVWRGPMVMAAVEKLVRGTEWGRLDVLVVDMPPGTGDVQLSMSQRVRLSGAVVVSTPQDLALMDARRGVTMFRQVNVPVLGVVENMSYFTCPACSHRATIFGHGGARQAAADLGIEFLAEVPLLPSIRSRSDSGLPVALGASAAAASGRGGATEGAAAVGRAAEGGGAAEEGADTGSGGAEVAEGGGAAEEGADAGSGGAEAAVVATYESMARRVWEKLEEQSQAGGAASFSARMAAPRVYWATHGRPAYFRPSLGLPAFRDVVDAFGLFDGSITPGGVVSCPCYGCQQWKDFTAGRLSWPATWQAATGADNKGRGENEEQQEEQRGGYAVAVKAAAGVGVGVGGAWQRGEPGMAARVHYEVLTQDMLLALAAYIQERAGHYRRTCGLASLTVLEVRRIRRGEGTFGEVGAGDGLLACKLRQCLREWGAEEEGTEGDGAEGEGADRGVEEGAVREEGEQQGEEQHQRNEGKEGEEGGERMVEKQPSEVVNGNLGRQDGRRSDREGEAGGEWVRLEGLWTRVIATDAMPRRLPGGDAATCSLVGADSAGSREGSGAPREKSARVVATDAMPRRLPGGCAATCSLVGADSGATREGSGASRGESARVEAGDEVIACDAEEAIAEYKPHIVIACWMPLGVDWTAAMRRQASVREYILVGEKEGGICGHHLLTWRFPGLLTWRRGCRLKRIGRTSGGAAPATRSLSRSDDALWKDEEVLQRTASAVRCKGGFRVHNAHH